MTEVKAEYCVLRRSRCGSRIMSLTARRDHAQSRASDRRCALRQETRCSGLVGSPRRLYAVEICGWHKDYAHALRFGRGIGVPDYENANTIVLWGHNPARTWLAQATRVADATRRGANVIVIDPKCNGSGEGADLWLPTRPGTDGALAMSGIRHLCETNGFDHEFVRQWTNAPFLVNHSAGRFVRASDLWRDGDSKAFLVGGDDRAVLSPLCRLSRLAYHSRTGVGQHINATMTERAIARLSAMTGANGS